MTITPTSCMAACRFFRCRAFKPYRDVAISSFDSWSQTHELSHLSDVLVSSLLLFGSVIRDGKHRWPGGIYIATAGIVCPAQMALMS